MQRLKSAPFVSTSPGQARTLYNILDIAGIVRGGQAPTAGSPDRRGDHEASAGGMTDPDHKIAQTHSRPSLCHHGAARRDTSRLEHHKSLCLCIQTDLQLQVSRIWTPRQMLQG